MGGEYWGSVVCGQNAGGLCEGGQAQSKWIHFMLSPKLTLECHWSINSLGWNANGQHALHVSNSDTEAILARWTLDFRSWHIPNQNRLELYRHQWWRFEEWSEAFRKQVQRSMQPCHLLTGLAWHWLGLKVQCSYHKPLLLGHRQTQPTSAISTTTMSFISWQ